MKLIKILSCAGAVAIIISVLWDGSRIVMNPTTGYFVWKAVGIASVFYLMFMYNGWNKE